MSFSHASRAAQISIFELGIKIQRDKWLSMTPESQKTEVHKDVIYSLNWFYVRNPSSDICRNVNKHPQFTKSSSLM